MSGMLERLGRRAVRHRWWFIATWFVMAVVVVALAIGLDAKLSDNFRIPDAQSQEALDLLEQDFPAAAGDNALVAIQATDGIKSPKVQAAIESGVAALEKIDGVTSVTDPFGPLGGAAISKNGQIAVLTVQFDTKAQNLEKSVYGEITAAMAPTVAAGAKVAYGGAVIDYLHQPPSGNADLIGLLAAVVILLFAFGSVVAMGLPILTALLGLGVGLSLIQIIASFTEIGTVAPVLATMIGLGVGIDYSLFIVTRYRENRAANLPLEAAVGRSVATAGSAVLFAGSTVVIAICGLAISGIPYVAKLGYMSGVMVAVMMTAALTLLPAIIAVVGNGIDRWKVPSLIHHPDRAAATGTATGDDPVSPARASGSAGPPSSPSTRGRSRSSARSSSSSSPGPSSRCAWASPTTATCRRRRPSARPTTSWPRASARARTARCSWSCRCRHPATTPCSPTSARRCRRHPASPPCSRLR